MGEKRRGREMKAMARQRLLGNYGNAAGAMLLMTIISYVAMVPMQMVNFMLQFRSGLSAGVALVQGMLVTMAFMILYMLIGQLLMAGYMRLCYRIQTTGESRIEDLFFTLRNHPLRFIGLQMLLTLIMIAAYIPTVILMALLMLGVLTAHTHSTGVMVAGLFLVMIPGISFLAFVFIRFMLALNVLVEDPEMGVMEALHTSCWLMQGNKWRLVKLLLSFIGIFLLAYLSLGLAMLWVSPYIMCTCIQFYLDVKREKNPPTEPEQQNQMWQPE